MKKAIGIRVKPDEVHYCVCSEEGSSTEILIVDKIVIPQALEIPEQLKFLRNTLIDIINENNVDTGCIRITESNARTIHTTRVYMEGVIQELIASSSINKYYVGQIANISAKLDIAREDFKPYAQGKSTFLELDFWAELSLESRESIMSSISALNL